MDTTANNAYTVKTAWKFETVTKTEFSSRLPLRHHIAKLAMFSVDPSIILYASIHHQHTILATSD